TFDRSVDVLYVDGVRFVAGTAPLEASSAWEAKGQLVVITGGTRGIGRKLGERLAASGAEVVLVGRSAPDGVLPERVRFVAADVTVKESIVSALADLAPTTLIHSAGVLADGPLGTVAAETGRAARVVKVDGLVHAIQACGPSLGRVLALGSWAGRFGNRAQSHYAA
ncbi:MAG TPA: SDR family NAD(P)-dependent oxidoreductase, partial [Myxococcota bacterium]|nr:SDR family NAD(P)-dependent oxidoreductase [Myxococcota bacterium]